MTVVPTGWMLYTPHDIAGLAKDALVIGPFGSNLKTSDYRDEGVPLVFVKDIRAEDFSHPRAYVSTAKAAELKAHQVLPGDILITKMGDPPGDVTIYDGDVPGIITADCIRLRPTVGFDRKYLVHSLRTPNARRQIDAITTGAAQKKVSLDRFRTRLHIAAPSLANQKRIAAVLDQVDTLRAKRRQAITLLDDLEQSIFLDAFGDPMRVAWSAETVADAGVVQLGRQRAPKYQTGQHSRSYLRVANVFEDRIDFDDVLQMDFDDSDFQKYCLKPGDILLNEGQSTELVGRPAMWRGERDGFCFQNTLVRFQACDRVLPEYALAVFLRYFRTGEFAKISSKTSSVAHLGAARFAKMPFHIPPMESQEKFRELASVVRQQRERNAEHLATLDELFTSLQHRAFSGTLWDHEASGEAA
ncbi:hypothetical protein G3I39_06425 [Streptomyces fulvissimus]|uniref:Type I restriction modification DNA specificity domain-containing protein n=1 Tax=Streptomyces microflavus TaxID=1919 RepID=A0A6N9V1D4_STRMI|nr:hypothetical protein [Streptomyces microflavus]